LKSPLLRNHFPLDNHHRGTEVKDSDLFRSYFVYSNGKSLHTGPSQPIWVVSSYPCFANLNDRLFWNHCSSGITCSLTPLDMVGLITSSYFFYANLKYLAYLAPALSFSSHNQNHAHPKHLAPALTTTSFRTTLSFRSALSNSTLPNPHQETLHLHYR